MAVASGIFFVGRGVSSGKGRVAPTEEVVGKAEIRRGGDLATGILKRFFFFVADDRSK
jgi:hypothetical protein